MATILAIGFITIVELKDGEKGDCGDKGDKGDRGDDGTNGKDAVEFIVSNAPLVFDTDENGAVSAGVSKTATIQVMRSGKNITSEVSNLFPSNSNMGCGKPTLTKRTDGIDVTISGASINKDSTLGVSVTSGYVIVYMAIGSTLYSQQIPFLVNLAKFTGTISADNKKLRTDYTELTNRVGAVETDVNGIPIKTQGELKKYTSTIEQTAREISLKVTEETVNMARNCIVGSALREYDEITPINGTKKVTIMTEGVGGTNYAQCYCIGATANSWTGLYFKDVRVKPQTKYIFSVWMRMTAKPDNGSYVAIKTYNTSVTGTEVARIKFPDSQTLNVWALYKVAVSVPAACNRLLIETGVRKNGAIDLCRPMLEEGDTYQGWSLSPYDVTIDDAVVATGLDIKNGKITLDAKNTIVTGNLSLYGTLRRKVTNITKENIGLYVKEGPFGYELSDRFWEEGRGWVNFTQGCLDNYDLGGNSFSIRVPFIFEGMTDTEKDFVRSLVGCQISLYNNSGKMMAITGDCYRGPLGEFPPNFNSFGLPSGDFLHLICTLGSYQMSGEEAVAWHLNGGRTL